MFVLLFKKFQKRSVYFYGMIAFLICGFSYMLGYWSGGEVQSVYVREWESCSLLPSARGAPAVGCGENASSLPLREAALTFTFAPRVAPAAQHWLHGMRAYLLFDEQGQQQAEDSKLRFTGELSYFDPEQQDPKHQWRVLEVASGVKDIRCSSRLFREFVYGCRTLPMFEVLRVAEDRYRFTVRVMGDCAGELPFISRMRDIRNVRLVLRHEAVRFSQAKAYLKAFFCPLALFAHLWFHETHRPFDSPLERILYAHSTTLIALNIPFEYFLLWASCPLWTLFVRVAEMAFQSTLYLSWVVFYKALQYEPPTDYLNYYRSHISMLFGWYILTISDAVERSPVIQDAFYTPMDYSINMFRETVAYEFIWSVVVLVAGFTVVYQMCRIYLHLGDEENILMVDLRSKKYFGLYQNCAFVPFALSLFSCVSMALIQFSHDLLLETDWKLRLGACREGEWCVAQQLFAPGLFTLMAGAANCANIAALLLLPTHIPEGWSPLGITEIPFYEQPLRYVINWRLQRRKGGAQEKEIATVLQSLLSLDAEKHYEENVQIEKSKFIV